MKKFVFIVNQLLFKIVNISEYPVNWILKEHSMKVIQETIGETTVFIQSFDEELEVIDTMGGGRATQVTGIKEGVRDAYKKLKSAITDIAKDISTDMRRIGAADRPKSLEIEFNVGISAQAGPVFLVGGGESSFKVTMNWDFDKYGTKA